MTTCHKIDDSEETKCLTTVSVLGTVKEIKYALSYIEKQYVVNEYYIP